MEKIKSKIEEADYFTGNKLKGDDFSIEEIKAWYEDEQEGYANLGAKDEGNYSYGYDAINWKYGYSMISPKDSVAKVLGIGSAYGHEFFPIINKIKELHIIEPSDSLMSKDLKGIKPIYHKPNINGALNFEDNSFDLITCFSTLHHIPNVSFVMKEMHRCLKPNGILLIKEPINSMGDWNKPRNGLTKNERGIPVDIFRKIIKECGFSFVKENLCLSMTAFISKLLKRPIYKNKTYLLFDSILSRVLQNRATKYHRTSFIQKIAPTSVYYFLKK